jgi:hypothetical protein
MVPCTSNYILIFFCFIPICIVKSSILVISIFVNYVWIVMSLMFVSFFFIINIHCTFFCISFNSFLSILIYEHMEVASIYFVFDVFSKLHMTFNKCKDWAWFYFRPIYINDFFLFNTWTIYNAISLVLLKFDLFVGHDENLMWFYGFFNLSTKNQMSYMYPH